MNMDTVLLTEPEINNRIKAFLVSKPNGNWHEEKVKQALGYEKGPDLVLVGGKRNSERFIVECKGKSYAEKPDSPNREGWLNALGQLITRMDTARVIKTGASKGTVNRAYKYGLGLYWIGARVALRRIPHEIARTLNLYIFSVYEDGYVRQWTPREIGREYPEKAFMRPQEAE